MSTEQICECGNGLYELEELESGKCRECLERLSEEISTNNEEKIMTNQATLRVNDRVYVKSIKRMGTIRGICHSDYSFSTSIGFESKMFEILLDKTIWFGGMASSVIHVNRDDLVLKEQIKKAIQ